MGYYFSSFILSIKINLKQIIRNVCCFYFLFSLENDISRLSFELMAAGTDTTSLTLTWACDYLTRAPPKESFKLSSDVIDMVHRWASVVPLSLPHIARESFKLKNYYIPKSSILIYNLYAVHNSQLKKLINTEQKSDEIQESDKPIPFSLGK